MSEYDLAEDAVSEALEELAEYFEFTDEEQTLILTVALSSVFFKGLQAGRRNA